MPGKNLITADTLSRAPLSAILTKAEKDLEKECKAYVDIVMVQIPATTSKLDQIKEAQNKDDTCRRLSGRITGDKSMNCYFLIGQSGQICM